MLFFLRGGRNKQINSNRRSNFPRDIKFQVLSHYPNTKNPSSRLQSRQMNLTKQTDSHLFFRAGGFYKCSSHSLQLKDARALVELLKTTF